MHSSAAHVSTSPPSVGNLRQASVKDLDALVELEQGAFSGDRLTRRQLRYLLTRAQATTLLIETPAGVVAGYVLVLFSRASAHARVYSIAVAEQARGRGLGRALIAAAEQASEDNDCVSIRLEVRRDNTAAIALYRACGYRQFDVVSDYYHDHEEALRFEKPLGLTISHQQTPVPYYRQTLEFTCGPAALIMAMKALDPTLPVNRELEITLWRESTTVFMTSGIGGCGPFGLAIAALNRGFGVTLYTSAGADFFADSVRSEVKKEVLILVQKAFIRDLKNQHVPIHHKPVSLAELRRRMETGAIPIVLISSYRIYGDKAPHWVVVTGCDERFVRVHDPYVDTDAGETVVDSHNMPILHREFARMTRYGRAGLKAVLFIEQGTPTHG
ncbi:MAG: GNAT family N-acetyltransferase/peptidase C39 family protein [Gammaproteobacteria bacterium]